ncbi:hypothetical protein KORDIASMS9_03730 [Kordia sp. SMS9]|uniref:hypothetical protein n=1 Tax=Kordia sp. SMS9 TaxID=2282170 RepID=UPI000E0D4EA9|nr:hypothetical protein [Kordia sp. SMS9]AXG71473.1 hypothetical protein KORDIASMS9_03730 [Kordia sp. SMS9]
METLNYIILGVCTIIAGILTAYFTYYYKRKNEKRRLKNITTLHNFEIINDSTDVLNTRLLPIIERLSLEGETIEINNIGLDLETVIPWINQKIIASKKNLIVEIKLKTLIIDDNSEFIKSIINGKSNIQSSVLHASMDIAQKIIQENYHNFTLEIKKYSSPPLIHGFIINNEHLFLGFTEIVNKKLHGGVFPYLYLKKDNSSDLNKHYFNFFKSWFDYYWMNAESMNNNKKL